MCPRTMKGFDMLKVQHWVNVTQSRLDWACVVMLGVTKRCQDFINDTIS